MCIKKEKKEERCGSISFSWSIAKYNSNFLSSLSPLLIIHGFIYTSTTVDFCGCCAAVCFNSSARSTVSMAWDYEWHNMMLLLYHNMFGTCEMLIVDDDARLQTKERTNEDESNKASKRKKKHCRCVHKLIVDSSHTM